MITKINPAGLFALCPIQPLDQVVSVNGVSSLALTISSAIKLMADSPRDITLVVHVSGGDQNLVATIISKPSQHFHVGIGLASADHRLRISTIAVDGLLANGLLNIGNECLYINGRDCTYLNATEAANLINDAPDHVTIVIAVVVASNLAEATRPTSWGPTPRMCIIPVLLCLFVVVFISVRSVKGTPYASNCNQFNDMDCEICHFGAECPPSDCK